MSKNKDRAKTSLKLSSLFSHAWKIAWSSKGLWIFSALSSLISITDFVGLRNLQLSATAFVFVGVIAVALSAYGSAGLIYGIILANSNNNKVSLREVYGASTRYFARLLITSSPLIVIAVILYLGAIKGLSESLLATELGLVLVIITLLLLIVLAIARVLYIPLGAMIYMIQLAIVVEDLGVRESIHRIWNILINNFWEIVRFSIANSFVFGFFILIINLPFLFAPSSADPSNSLIVSNGLGLFMLAGNNLALISYTPVAIFLASIANTCMTGAWVLAYKQLSSKLPISNRSDRQ